MTTTLWPLRRVSLCPCHLANACASAHGLVLLRVQGFEPCTLRCADVGELLEALGVPAVINYPGDTPCDDALGREERCVGEDKHACDEGLICLRWKRGLGRCLVCANAGSGLLAHTEVHVNSESGRCDGVLTPDGGGSLRRDGGREHMIAGLQVLRRGRRQGSRRSPWWPRGHHGGVRGLRRLTWRPLALAAQASARCHDIWHRRHSNLRMR